MMSPSATSLFVDYHFGGYPLLITCPHNGSQHPTSTPERPTQQPGCRNKKRADLFTRTIALGVFDSVQDSIGAAPSNVVARFHRRFIDANRPERCAFLAPGARPFYREYHRRIRRGIAKIKVDFPRRGLLVDIHGAADLTDQPGTHVLLGSDGGRSISRLLALDSKILWRRRGLVRTLEAAGFGVIPANAGDPEHPNFDGGFTVRRYGAVNASGLDALQIEIVRSVREDAQQRKALVQALAEGLIRLLAQQRRLILS
jgi:N-formylglutamate amidohydrolase